MYPLDHTKEIPRWTWKVPFIDLSACRDPDQLYVAIFAFQKIVHVGYRSAIRFKRDLVTLDDEGNLHIRGKLELTDFKGLLPDCLTSVEYLWLCLSGITRLPARLTRVGTLDLSRTYGLVYLPDGLHIDMQFMKNLDHNPSDIVCMEGSTLFMERLAREAGIAEPRWESSANFLVVPKGRVLWEMHDENGLRVAHLQRTGGPRVMIVNRKFLYV